MTDGTAQLAAAENAAAPRDYQLAVPEGWVRVVLDPQTWGQRADRIVERQFRGRDDVPHLKAMMRDRFVEQAAAAYATGGLELYMWMQAIVDVPMGAGLLVSLIPQTEQSGVLPPVDDVALSYAADGDDVRMVDLAAGPAMRRRYRVLPAADDPDGNTLPITHLDFQIAVPNAPGHLLLSFSTPVDVLADQLVVLFETIAGTLKWVA
jgi:hypothetical protein